MTVAPDSNFSGTDGNDKVWPPGFRFHPTDEELVMYYLKRKIFKRKLKPDIIREMDVYQWEPEELPGQSILKTGDRQWFFFSPRNRKYPKGSRSSRATRQGYWKATGKDRNVMSNSQLVGVKKTLVFYRGRAPNGERTNWVMHEYAIDEVELKRSNGQDDYALYKVYQKSGAGPRNGEQYGAPFKEEDWADDECADVANPVNPDIPDTQHNGVTFVGCVGIIDQVQLLNDIGESIKQIADGPAVYHPQVSNYTCVLPQDDEYAEVNSPVTPDIPVKQQDMVTPVDSVGVIDPVEPLLNDFEEIMKQIADGPALDQPQISNYTYVLPQVAGEEDAQSMLVDPFCMEVLFPEQTTVAAVSGQQNDKQGSFAFNQSATSGLQLVQAPVVTAAHNYEQPSQLHVEDFLEVNDLVGPQPTLPSIEKPVENFQFDDFDGLTVLDLYQDALMFFGDIEPVGQETFSHPYMNPHGNSIVSEFGDQLQTNSVANQVDYQLQQPYLLGNQLDYQLQPQSFGNGQMCNQLCLHDQRINLLPPESHHGTQSQPSPGISHESVSNPAGTDGKQSGIDGGGGADGWFSSALWSLVESIPTSPASASESHLVNKAFERMSSFSMGMNAKSTKADSSNGAANVRKAGGNRGFIYLSIFGALCAILWVLIGTVRVLGRCISF